MKRVRKDEGIFSYNDLLNVVNSDSKGKEAYLIKTIGGNMNKLGMYVFLMTALLSLVGCGGSGGGSTSTGGTQYTHEQLANEFVKRVNSDVYGYDLQLVKSNTQQYDYIVVYDHYYRTYDAYYIGAYNVGENMSYYLNSYSSYFYYGLRSEGSVYVDPYTLTRFEKQEVSSKNLAKIQAIKEQLTVSNLADKLKVQYGLSSDKSLDIASFAYKVENSPKGTFKSQDYDSFVKELTGSSITEFKGDILSGNSTSLEARIQEASKMTGIGPEGVNKLISDLFTAK